MHLWRWLAAPAIAASVLLAGIWRDYRAVEDDFRLMRFEHLRIGNLKAAAALRPEPPQPAPGTTPAPDEIPNPAMWAWNLMAQASKSAAQAAQAAQVPRAPKPAPAKRKKPAR